MRALIAALALACAIDVAHAADDDDRSAIRNVIERQLDAFRRDDALEAYSYAAPSIQSLFPSEDRFMNMVRQGYRPVYRPRSHAFDEFKETAAGPAQFVRLTDADGVDWIAVYTLERQSDGTWKISGCQLLRLPGEAA